MAIDEWVIEAIETHGGMGITLLAVQRYIDEYHNEELALNTIRDSLISLANIGRLINIEDLWYLKTNTSKEDALKKLFGDD